MEWIADSERPDLKCVKCCGHEEGTMHDCLRFESREQLEAHQTWHAENPHLVIRAGGKVTDTRAQRERGEA